MIHLSETERVRRKCPREGCNRKTYWIGAPVTLCYPHNKESYPNILNNYLAYKRRKAICKIQGCRKIRIKSGLCHTHSKEAFPDFMEALNKRRIQRYHERWKDKSFQEYTRSSAMKIRRRVRYEVLYYYSNGRMICECCKEGIEEFLSIDHINGRTKDDDVGGYKLYLLLRRRGFPKGYRVLCHNCNQSFGYFGYCPHDKSGALAQDVYDTPNDKSQQL